MRDDRQVKFNVTIAKYEHEQVVNYADMPPGHQHWVNNKIVLESTRICEFVEDEILPEAEAESVKENDVPTDLTVSEKEPEVVTTSYTITAMDSESIDQALKKGGEKAIQDIINTKPIPETEDTEPSAEPTTRNGLSFNFDKDYSETFENASDDTQKPTCRGKKADGSPCERFRLKSNGYCFQHQDQAPGKWSG